jgi:GH25 family lysozyme M1 (1,4-beta-N-acetylmuramidase)
MGKEGGKAGWKINGISQEQYRAELVAFNEETAKDGVPCLIYEAGAPPDWAPFEVETIAPITEHQFVWPTAPSKPPGVPAVAKRIGKVQGIDVSNNQGKIDWTLAGDAGYEFAFIKRSEGTDFVDQFFDANWKGAKDNGLVRGAYHFGRASVNSGHTEAKFFVDLVKDWQTGDIAILDLEDDKVPAGAGLADYTVDFCETVRSLIGFAPMIYTGTYYLTDHGMIGDARLGGYGLWLAAYQTTPPPAPAPWDFWAVWQYNDHGRVPGIAGDVDINLFNGPRSQLVKYGKP